MEPKEAIQRQIDEHRNRVRILELDSDTDILSISTSPYVSFFVQDKANICKILDIVRSELLDKIELRTKELQQLNGT